MIEQRLDFSCYVPDGFGTGDCVIISDHTLHIIDFKYGQGVLVEAENNPQMMLYALGALAIYECLYDIDEVSMTIYQPRRENISTWTISVDELKRWAERELIPKAKLAFEGKGEYHPGVWCVFCKAAVKCRARAEEKLALARYEFAQPSLLTDAEIEDILGKLDDLTRWAEEIKAYAQDAALNHGKQWKMLYAQMDAHGVCSSSMVQIEAADSADVSYSSKISRRTTCPIWNKPECWCMPRIMKCSKCCMGLYRMCFRS